MTPLSWRQLVKWVLLATPGGSMLKAVDIPAILRLHEWRVVHCQPLLGVFEKSSDLLILIKILLIVIFSRGDFLAARVLAHPHRALLLSDLLAIPFLDPRRRYIFHSDLR